MEHLALPLASSVTLGEVPPSLCLLPICKMEITIHVHHRNVCAFNDACVCVCVPRRGRAPLDYCCYNRNIISSGRKIHMNYGANSPAADPPDTPEKTLEIASSQPPRPTRVQGESAQGKGCYRHTDDS